MIRLKDTKDSIKLVIALGTLVLNFLLVYILLYDPLSQFLIDKNQPYNIPSSRTITAITFSLIASLILTSIILLVEIARKQKIFIYAPILSLAVLISICLISYFSLAYPSSTSEYVKNGYYYKMEIWWNTSDHKKTYKRWRSITLYDGHSKPDKLKYKLDSLSITTDN